MLVPGAAPQSLPLQEGTLRQHQPVVQHPNLGRRVRQIGAKFFSRRVDEMGRVPEKGDRFVDRRGRDRVWGAALDKRVVHLLAVGLGRSWEC